MRSKRRHLILRQGQPVAVRYKTEKPVFSDRLFTKKGDDILSHNNAVPSAQAGLTSLFGMGRGEPRRNNHLKSLVALGNLSTCNC